ncbi:glutamate-rich protein 2 isoform X2 [Clinocottus analis]|uniref:glutamate-rich protein 2 isoform X2 n=1 Tax=Clinocottus analis TaxID=304258 RepID=UPI0035BFB749
MAKNKVTDKSRRSLPTQVLCSVKVSCQKTQKSGFPSGALPDTDKFSAKESNKRTLGVGEHTQFAAVADDELKIKDLRNIEPPESKLTAMPLPIREPNGEEQQTEEEDVEDEDITAPVELIMEFLRAAGDRDYQLASKLCQMILIYEPDNPEASEFLPLIQRKLLEEQESEQSTEENEEDDDEDSGSDGDSSKSSRRSSSSCSSSSLSDDDDDDDDDDDKEKEKQVNRHKPCPPCHISP